LIYSKKKKIDEEENPDHEPSIEDYHLLKVIGKGGFY